MLIIRLHDYLVRNHPDLLLTLQGESNVTSYLNEKVAAVDDLTQQLLAEGKPAYVILNLCMEVLTKDLAPSKFNYICTVLEEEFEALFYQLKQDGTLVYEVVNLITICTPRFEEIGFTENEEGDKPLRYAVTGMIQDYLAGNPV